MKNPGDMYDDVLSALRQQANHLEVISKKVTPPARIPFHRIEPFTIAASGWNQIVPQSPNRVAVIAFVAVAAGTVNFTLGQGSSASDAAAFPSHSAASAGALPLAANTGFSMATSWPSYLFATEPNMGLFINLDAAVSVSGFATYALLFSEQDAAG